MGWFSSNTSVRDKAISEITKNLQTQLGGYIRFGDLIGSIQRDPYIAGYIHGKLLSFNAYYNKAEGMPAEDGQVVTGAVLINLFGREKAMTVSQAIGAHGSYRSAQYLDGQRKGAQIVAYAVGAQDVRQDPEYRQAIATYRTMASNHRLEDHWAAITGLEHRWFGTRMA